MRSGWIVAAALVALAAARPAPAPVETVRITIENIAFVQASTHAYVGDTVEWVNKDTFVHTATAKNGAWKAIVQPGKSARIKMTRAGTFDYYCEFHPNMIATLTVTERPKGKPKS